MNTLTTTRILMAVLVSACCFVTPAFAQVDMIIVINGIEGSSRILPGAIDVRSSQLGASQTISTGGGAGVTKFTDLTVSKPVDKSTPKLMEACATGKHLTAATLFVRKTKSDGRQEYLIYELEDVIVTSIQTSAGGDDDPIEHAPSETLSLNYEKIKVKVLENGEVVEFAWNIATNSKQ